MPVTRYYGQNNAMSSTTPSGLPTTEQSTAFPWGSTASATDLVYCALGTTRPAAYRAGFGIGTINVVSGNQEFALGTSSTLAQTARQSTFCGYGYYRLGAQTIPSGTWSFATSLYETNLNVNQFAAVSIYVWRPSTSSVVGFIYDSQTQLGVEPNTASSVRTSLFSVSGSSITTQNDDYLVVELWVTGTQGMATAYQWHGSISGSGQSDSTASQQTVNATTWLDAPDTLVPFSSGPTTWDGAVTYSGASVYQSDDRLTAAASVSYSGSSTFTSDDGLIAQASTSFAGSSTFTSDDRLVLNGAVSYAGSSTFASDDTAIRGGAVAYAGSSTLVSDDRLLAAAAVTFAGSSTFSADGTLIAGTTQVAVPSTRVKLIANPPTLVPGAVSLAVPTSTLKLVANAPAISTALQVAVPPSRITLTANAPAVVPTVTRAVPFSRVTLQAIPPVVVPGTRSLTPQIASLRLLAVAPEVQNFILVPAATLRLLAVAPSVTGGGGGGGGTVTLRKSGD